MSIFYDTKKSLIEALTDNKVTWVANRIGNKIYKDKKEFDDNYEILSKKYDVLFDVNNLTNSMPVYINKEFDVEVNLEELLSTIAHSPVENLLIIVIDQLNPKIVNCKIVGSGDERSTGGTKTNIAAFEYLKNFQSTENNYYSALFVHNHPRALKAEPSKNDIEYNEILKNVCKFFGIKYADSLIVTDFDCWSESQTK